MVKSKAQDIRNDIDNEFQNVCESSKVICDADGIDELTVPRRCGRQNKRNNVQAETVEVYCKRAVFVPYVDHLITELGP